MALINVMNVPGDNELTTWFHRPTYRKLHKEGSVHHTTRLVQGLLKEYVNNLWQNVVSILILFL